MSLTLSQEKLILTSIGAVMVIAGVVVKNSASQFGMNDNIFVKITGPALFVIGWAIVAYSVAGIGDIKKIWLPWLSIAVIVGSVFMTMIMKNRHNAMGMIYPTLFVIGWLVFAYEVGKRNKFTLGLSISSAILVFLSMMYFLPMQRERCIVDGPGFALFTIAWAGIVFANSLKY